MANNDERRLELIHECRGEGLGYLVFGSAKDHAGLSASACTKDGRDVPCQLFRLTWKPTRDIVAPGWNHAWIAVVPLLTINQWVDLREGTANTGKPLCRAVFSARTTKVASRLLTVRYPLVASTMRGYEQRHTAGTATATIREVWPGQDDTLVWRIGATFPTASKSSPAQLKVFDAQAEEVPARVIVMEDQIAPSASDPARLERLVTFSMTLPDNLRDFHVVARVDDVNGVGLAGMNAPRADSMIADVCRRVAGAGADPTYPGWFDVHRATDAELTLQRNTLHEALRALEVSADDEPTNEPTITSQDIGAPTCPKLPAYPQFGVVLLGPHEIDPSLVQETLASLEAQSYDRWQLCDARGGEDAPDAPDACDTSDAPAALDAPDLFDAPDATSAVNAADAPVATSAASISDVPVAPGAPNVTSATDVSDVPVAPGAPDLHGAPDATIISNTADAPEIADAPETTGTASAADAAVALGASDASSTSVTLDASIAPEAPDTPGNTGTSDTPGTLGTPAAPEATDIPAISVDSTDCDLVVCVTAGMVLEPDALWHVAQHAIAHPEADLFYGDDDFLRNGTPCRPRFKGFPNYGSMYTRNEVGEFLVLRKDAYQCAVALDSPLAEGPAQAYDLALRGMEVAKATRHIPRVLSHIPTNDMRWGEATVGVHEDRKAALSAHLTRRNIAAQVEDGSLPNTFHVNYQLPKPAPLVSIVIPTRDQAQLLRTCVESILDRSTYPRIEVVLVENNSVQPETFALYEELQAQDERVRVVTWMPPEPGAFNYSALINYGVAHATGELLVLLNNDTEVIEPTWIEEMAGCLQRPEVGVVGAKLLFEDGLIQHVGMAANPSGDFCHVCQNLTRDAAGPRGAALLPGDYSMVTGACQMVSRALFDELGGYDERLAVGFNDGDFCLRAGEAGRSVTVAARAVLYHREFSTRGREISDVRLRARFMAEKAYVMGKHPEFFGAPDPSFNPNLNGYSAYFEL